MTKQMVTPLFAIIIAVIASIMCFIIGYFWGGNSEWESNFDSNLQKFEGNTTFKGNNILNETHYYESLFFTTQDFLVKDNYYFGDNNLSNYCLIINTESVNPTFIMVVNGTEVYRR